VREEGEEEGAEAQPLQLRFPKPVVLAANKVRGCQWWVSRSISQSRACFVLFCFVRLLVCAPRTRPI
jgi:hypothetical protein